MEKAANEQGLTELVKKFKKIVPDISEKETGEKFERPYLTTKVYAQYSFQM